MKKRFPYIATLCVIMAISILCGLGRWQLQRLEWKTALLERLDAEYKKDAELIEITPQDLDEDFALRRGTVRGAYEFENQIAWIPRLYDRDPRQSVPGKDIITPLRLSDGSLILVDRGWAPSAWDPESEDPRPKGSLTVTGTIRPLSEHNPFTAQNKPDKGQWYHPDPDEYAAFYKIKNMRPYIVFREDIDRDGAYPLPSHDRPEISNNHLQYAIFWFAMAFALAVIYMVRFFIKE